MRSRLTLLVLAMLVLAACQIPATPSPPSPTVPPPTETPPPPPTATMMPGLTEGLVKIPSATGEVINAEVKGSGDTVIVFANMADNYSGNWLKLINALDRNKFTLVNFNYTLPDRETALSNLDAVLKFLDEHGVKRMVCVGASLGTMACTHAANHPGMAGQVFMSGPIGDSLAEVKYPKLFVVAEKDGEFTDSTYTMYTGAAAPKALKIYPGYAHGAALFLDNSLDTAQYVADFLNHLP